jgi:hypothetical protein
MDILFTQKPDAWSVFDIQAFSTLLFGCRRIPCIFDRLLFVYLNLDRLYGQRQADVGSSQWQCSYKVPSIRRKAFLLSRSTLN